MYNQRNSIVCRILNVCLVALETELDVIWNSKNVYINKLEANYLYTNMSNSPLEKYILTNSSVKILKDLRLVIQCDLMLLSELRVQIHLGVEQLIVVVILDLSAGQNSVDIGSVTDETTGV